MCMCSHSRVYIFMYVCMHGAFMRACEVWVFVCGIALKRAYVFASL